MGGPGPVGSTFYGPKTIAYVYLLWKTWPKSGPKWPKIGPLSIGSIFEKMPWSENGPFANRGGGSQGPRLVHGPVVHFTPELAYFVNGCFGRVFSSRRVGILVAEADSRGW